MEEIEHQVKGVWLVVGHGEPLTISEADDKVPIEAIVPGR